MASFFNVSEWVKSPIPYAGSKFDMLDELGAVIRTGGTLVDLFTGSGVVGANMAYRFDRVLCFDILQDLIAMHEKVTEDEIMAASKWCWEMKNFLKGEDSVTLYHLDEGCYWDFLNRGKLACRALKECWVVAYSLNDIGTRALFDDEAEAIDFTLKIIELIKA